MRVGEDQPVGGTANRAQLRPRARRPDCTGKSEARRCGKSRKPQPRIGFERKRKKGQREER